MKFHEIHGVNVCLDESRRVARRINSFCDAFVFSEVPIHLNSFTALKLFSHEIEWQGRCFLGVTSRNPISFIEGTFSKHLITLLDSEDVWIKSIPEAWSCASLMIHLTYDGQLEITTEHEPNARYVFFENLPVNFPLWLVIELYGASNCVRFPTFNSPNSSEIISLGSDSMATFKCAEEGILPYNFARVVLIGPKSSGKTMLKNILSNNLNNDPTEIDSLQTTSNCLTADNGEWHLFSALTTKVDVEERAKTEVYFELAQNIVHEIVITSKEQLESTSAALSSKDLIKNVLKFPRKMRKSYLKEVKQLSENVNEIPEELMVIIEDLLKNVSHENETTVKATTTRPLVTQKHVVNLCDFSGNLLYLIINQFFFTSCAVYMFVFNLSDDLDASCVHNESINYISELHNQSITFLNLIHVWLSLIHTTIATFATPSEEQNTEENTSNNTNNESSNTGDTPKSTTTTNTFGQTGFDVQPQILLVGTHRNSIHAEPITRDQIVKEIYEKIFSSLADKSYASHLYKNYVALDCKEMSFDEPNLIQNLKKLIEMMIVEEKTTGFNIPLPWIQLGYILEKLKQRGIYFVDINQLHEVVSSQVESFQSYDNLNAALHFYHNQSKIFYLDCVGQNNNNNNNNERHNSYELGIIILDPNWFINCVYLLCVYVCNCNVDDDNLQLGVISENVINCAWAECIDQKFILLGCLENLDIICELSPYIQLEDAPDVAATSMVPKLYFFPWISKPVSESDVTPMPNENFGNSTFQFVISFHLLPISLFTRLLIRLSKWSWNQGWGRKPEIYNSRGRIAVDFDHDMILKINLLQGRIYVVILKIFEELQNDQIENLFIGPAANVCVKVQHLVESELESLKSAYYRRLNYWMVIPCPCNTTCTRHKVEGCIDEKCLHFLNLQECLKKKVVECKYNRQVRTTFIQRYLPYAPTLNSELMYESIYNQNSNEGWDNIFQVEPLWMREAAKLLNASQTNANNDWITLAKRLSYSERDVSKFAEDISPSLTLLKDWFESNGRTRYCIDVLVSCLRMLSRDDIASLIEYELEPESNSPPIFLSYQRDSQKQVLEIRRKLELSGFPCWMDTSSISGGELLYGKIYEGISRAKVVICCLTPRYIASPMCNREVTLADVLHKPILPLIIEFTPWPPPGGMALIMSSIVYIDLCGVGSHSGIGKLQDTESRFREILDRVSRYISGYSDMPVVSARYLQLPDLFTTRRNESGPSVPINNELVRQVSDPRSLSSLIESEQERNTERSRSEDNLRETELPFSEDIISGDNISVISRTRIANRITNCSVCTIM